MSMSTEELLKARQAMVHHIFSCTGDEFISEVLKNGRGAPSALTEDMKQEMRVEEYAWHDFIWWKFMPAGAPKGKTRKVLYLHGGGWVLESGIVQYQFAGYLSEKLGCEVWFPEYPLVPEHNGEIALDMVFDLYRQMLESAAGDEIAIGGDSAGAGLAVSLVQHLIQKGLALPNTLLLVSPALFCFDSSRNREEQEYMDITAKRDPVISLNAFPTVLQHWKGSLDAEDYRVNPSTAALKGFPATIVFSGGYESMERGIRTFVEKMIALDLDVRYYVRNRKIHNFVLSEPDAEAERNLIVQRLLDPDHN